MSDLDDKAVRDAVSAVRDMIRHEDVLLNQRLIWMWTLQGLLFGASSLLCWGRDWRSVMILRREQSWSGLVVVGWMLGFVVVGDAWSARGVAQTGARTSPATLEQSSSSSRSSDDPVAELLRHVEKETGPAPVECGRHLLRPASLPAGALIDALRQSVACGQAAAALKRPFWLFLQRQGIDSWVATGLLGRADGTIHIFFYDDDPSGGSRLSPPRINVRPCVEPAVSPQQAFTCGPLRK